MSVIVYTSIELEPIECCNCGVIFGMPPQWIANRKETKDIFYCPNGHGQSYTESTADHLRKQLEEEKKKLANSQFELMAAKQRTQAVEREKARLQKRIKNGVCPCCHRQFTQLSRHMKSKHPEFEAA